MFRPGPRNLITDVPGLAVGNATDPDARTGVTVLLPDRRVVAGVDVRGGAPGTRETDLLEPTCLVDAVDAVVLSGGSAFGLDAAQGAMSWLAERGRGFPVAHLRVPIVPAAILFDLLNGGDGKERVSYRELAERACASAGPDFDLGNAGAGFGARAGELKGGLGSASVAGPDGIVVGALVAANPIGAATLPGQPQFWAWALEQGDEFGGLPPPTAKVPLAPDLTTALRPGANTLIGVVATDAPLTKAQAQRVAIMAQDGYARAVRPVHTPFDGDVVFALSTGTGEPVDSPALARIGALAADCVARAVARAVYSARTLGDLVAWRDRWSVRAQS